MNLARGCASGPLRIIFPRASGQTFLIYSKFSVLCWSGMMQTLFLAFSMMVLTSSTSVLVSLICTKMIFSSFLESKQTICLLIFMTGISQMELYLTSTLSFGQKNLNSPGVPIITILIKLFSDRFNHINSYMRTTAALVLLVAILALLHSAQAWKQARTFRFKNSAGKTIWVGGFGVPLMAQTGWEMPPNTQYTVQVAANTVAIRYWARTGCNWKDGKFVCTTGDCGAPPNNFGIQCRGITGQSPATLIELTLSNSGNPDFYDLSNVDGNNLNVRFGPIPGTFIKVNNPDLGKFNCGSPSCTFNQNVCPQELKLQKSDGTYCMSICAAVYNNEQVNKYPSILGPIAGDQMKRDLVCCACGAGTGGCTDPRSHFCCSPFDPRPNTGGKCYVQNWPKPSQFFDRYDHVFKNQCSQAYSWQFDDLSSTYQCIDGDYEIEFF